MENSEKSKTFPEMEEEVNQFWQNNNIFEKSINKEAPQGDYVFYDGPPFATGTPHYGHITGSVMKDVIPRYWTMCGYKVERKWGWDCHGLPIENIVEKEMGSMKKKDIEAIGVTKFNALCRQRVWGYVDEWEKVIRKLGRWADMKNAYKTMDLDYMESIWWVFKELYSKGLIYEGHRPMHVCPRCETTLSQSEVAEGYKDIKDLSVIAKFKLIQTNTDIIRTDADIFVLAWTTTPWTLIGNVALAINKEVEYCLVKFNEDFYIVAKERVEQVFKDKSYEIVKEFKGEKLIGLSYEPVFDYYLDKNEKLLNSTKEDNGSKEVPVLAIVNKNGEILFGFRQYTKDKPDVGRDFWIAPGGKVEVGETFINGIARELKEECNITDFKVKKYLGTYPGYSNNHVLYCFLLEVDDITQIKNNEPEKFSEWKFFPTTKLPVADFPNTTEDERFFTETIKWHNAFRIYHADYVTTEDGTGVVHIAPAFGADDMEVGKKYNLPFVQHVNIDGTIKDEVTDLAGLNVKPIQDHTSTDVEIIKNLAHRGLLFHKEKFEHSYPHCWRCDTPLINYATTSWFVAIEKIKDKMLETAANINWSPAHIKEGRFGQWLAGARDWSISRQRFWASVMPVWRCKSDGCDHQVVLGSVAELEKLSGIKVADLHKDVVDEVTFKCEKCGGTMHRIPDVLDTWFDSGSMPYAQMHYPFENKEKFEANFPAEFIAEGQDQCRCWFYYLHAIGNGIKGSHAFKNVIVNGIVLAEDGKKMAKKLKNYPDPTLLLDKYGADALRFYLLSSPVMQAENINFTEKSVLEALQKNIMILWNVVKFYELFSENYELRITNYESKSENILDQWILARLDQLIGEVTKHMNTYDLPRSVRPITEFVNDLSTWYIRRSRDRFKSEDETDKNAAIATTKFALVELSKLMAPFTPFIAEQVWQSVTGLNFSNENRSVHLEAWPETRSTQHVTRNNIIEEMEQIRKIVEIGLSKRDEVKIKIRQPLNKFSIFNFQFSNNAYEELIKDELNVKNIECVSGNETLSISLDTEITPELKLEGIKRDLVRFVNAIRKDMNLSLNNRTEIYYETESELIRTAIEKHTKELMNDTLSETVKYGLDNIENKKEVKIDGEIIVLGLTKK